MIDNFAITIFTEITTIKKEADKVLKAVKGEVMGEIQKAKTLEKECEKRFSRLQKFSNWEPEISMIDTFWRSVR